MKKESPFFRQSDLLLRLLPHIASDSDFALHGGTAINFFVRDLPRLSVDIDLTYLPLGSRDEAIKNMTKKLHQLSKRFRNAFPGIHVEEKEDEKRNISKLIVNYQNALVKIEPNLVIRGSVFHVVERDLSKKAQEEFGKFVTVKILPPAALYGSKICAALDRQHPRDLFDIKLFFENEKFNDDIRKAFLVYLMSSNRPMNELLNPKRKDGRKIFENEFSGMTLTPVTYEELEQVREKLIETIKTGLKEKDRKFLVSFKEGNPNWELFSVADVDKLPAVQWKLANLAKMDRKKHSHAVDKLKKALGYGP